ncbi:MAG: RNB domain-containing ribonuclease, partial [Angustibacter sp.]
MAPRRVRVLRDSQSPNGQLLNAVFQGIRDELDIPPSFPAPVLSAAAAAGLGPVLPELDRTDIPFFTIDPIGSRDLDQAIALERTPAGYRIYYAIADVTAFVAPGSPVDVEARRRGQTLYAPDLRISLHPPALSEDAASLLPDRDRPAYVWDMHVDSAGELRSANVQRALVRSRERLDYESVQQHIDAGTTDDRFQLLAEIGGLRQSLEAARGGASLPMPEQEVELTAGHYRTRLRPATAVEGWNAQISLLT